MLASGLQFVHSYNFIHRDLKPSNLLLTEDSETAVLKIADFGFARYIQPLTMAETLCGSPLYMAPEILRFQKYDAKADLWSVGAILFELLSGRPPFRGENHLILLKNIERQELRLPKSVIVSDECLNLLQGLLKRNPMERMSYQDFFAHPFVNLHNSVSVLIAPEPNSTTAEPQISTTLTITTATAAAAAVEIRTSIPASVDISSAPGITGPVALSNTVCSSFEAKLTCYSTSRRIVSVLSM